MNGDNDPARLRTDWQVLKEELLEPLRQELVPLAAGMQAANEDHMIELRFEDLSERTKCAEHPNGMDFTSDPGSHRHYFYERRVQIADEFMTYYTSIYGVGMKFTANALLGLKWKEEYELELSYSMAGTTEALWSIARGQVPLELRGTCDFFLTRTAQRRALITRTKQEGRAEYLRLARGEDEDEEEGDGNE